jgi:hypothetical protein
MREGGGNLRGNDRGVLPQNSLPDYNVLGVDRRVWAENRKAALDEIPLGIVVTLKSYGKNRFFNLFSNFGQKQ